MKWSCVFRVSLTTIAIVAMAALPSWARQARIMGGAQGQINVRDIASTNSVVVAYAASGEIIEILASEINKEDGYGWYKVKLPNRAIGWVRADLVRFETAAIGFNNAVPVTTIPNGVLPIGDDTDVGYTMRIDAGGTGNQVALRTTPGADTNVAFYGRHGDRVKVEQAVTNRDGTWYYVSYPKALRGVVSSGWVRRDALVR
jgi:hypothetical protein